MKVYFSDSNYDTPKETPRRLLDRLALNTRVYFVSGALKEIIRARNLAVAGKYDREAWAESSYNIFKLIEGCGGRFHIKGLDNLRNLTGSVVFISNHMSTLETFVFPSIIAPLMEVTFVVKQSLVEMSLFGPVMRARQPIVVGRTNPREDLQAVMNQGKELLTKGVSIIIFPQSTRSTKFNPEEFNSLGVKLAKSAGAQVIPVAIKTDFWGNGKYIKDFGPVDRNQPINITFGEPMSIQGAGKEEHKRVVEFISTHLKEWNG